MRHIRVACQFLVYSNIFIAACATALTWETIEVLPLSFTDWPYLLVVFTATCFIYNLHYYRKKNNTLTDERTAWLTRNKNFVKALFVLTAVVCLITLMYYHRFFFHLHAVTGLVTIILLGSLFAISLAYSHVLLPGSKKAPLRYIGWLKVSVLSLVWAITTTIVPVLLAEGILFSNKVVMLFVHRLLFMVALVILFNIRDYEEDKAAGINTMAVLAGPAKTLYYGKWITLLLNFAAGLLLVTTFSLYNPAICMAVAIPPLLVFLLYQYFSQQSEASFILLNDGMMLLKALILIFAIRFFS